MASDQQRILRAARRYGRTLDPIAQRYTDPVTGKRLSGEALILKTVKGESGGRRDAVSSAGAKGIGQFMPGTRAAVIKQFGVDPWRSPEEAVHALTLHMRGKLGNATGLEGYNPGGGQSYVSYILGQRIGSQRAAGGGGGGSGAPTGAGTAASSGAAPAAAPQANPNAAFNPGALAQAMAAPELEKPQLAPSSGVAMPGILTPDFYQPVPTSGPPSPPPEPDLTAPAGQAVSFGGPAGTAPDGTAQPAGALSAGAPASSAQIANPNTARGNIAQIFERAATLDAKRLPYKWGGGHGKRISDVSKAEPLDCSGAVSAVLGVDPRVSGQFTKWGKPGAGGNVTVYANSEHVLMKIRGDDGKWHFFGTSRTNPGGGAGWIPASALGSGYLSRFTARHI